MKYNLGKVDDILSAFNLIQEKQEKTNCKLSRLSSDVSSINTRINNQVEVLRSQVYVFSGNMGWLGIWDTTTGSYKGFINTGASSSGEITIARETGNVYLYNQDENKIFIIDPYLPGITGSLPFASVASFAVTPDGKRLFISQANSSILVEVDGDTGKTKRSFTLPGTALHLVEYPEAFLLYFSVAGTKAIYSVQRLSGEVIKVFDLPDDAVKITPFKFGNEFGLLVLTGSGNSASITKWDIITSTTSTVQVPDASEIVACPFSGKNYVVSTQNILIRTLDGTVIKTVVLEDTATQLTLTADGTHLVAVVGPGQDAKIIDTLTGVVSAGPSAIYPPTQQTAQLLLTQAQFGFVSK
ncbi:YncE family protein [Pelotomaculum propionicicum]|uniref:Uncharacterized protein n=1 Tax=Pelotomaculum propionicicum TaxID=258475 RepID=A0A4Y7RMI7_9FIRM|nr:hypothetical protein [Pelotomaculum propionicicum]NLI13369.1 hypothetical protein [Peptococcaceae bacterium]TEB09517.1 hypothetical protein Pmgp_03062 [Pelotomaculum propionicicum]